MWFEIYTNHVNKFNYSGHLWWDRVIVYRRICSSFSSLFFFQVELLQLVARARNIFRSALRGVHYPESNFFCQPGVVALAGSLSCFFLKPSKLAQQTLRMV